MNERGEYVPLYTNVAGSSSTHARGIPMPGMPPLNPESGGTVPPSAPAGPPPPSASMPPGGQPPPSATMPQPPGHGIPPMGGTSVPPMWQSGPQGPTYSSAAMGHALWGYPDIKSFQNGLENAVCHFDGENWIDFKYDFQLLAQACGLWGFVLLPPQGYAMPNDAVLVHEFRRYNTTVFQGMHQRCTKSIQLDLRRFTGHDYAACHAWEFLRSKYESVNPRYHVQVQHMLQNLRMQQGKADDYIRYAKTLRDKALAAGLYIAPITFYTYLYQGLPKHWDSFRTHIKMQLHTISEEQLCLLILEEDREKSTHVEDMEGMFATKANISSSPSSPCRICGKSGHLQSKCYFNPPYYCPICKTTGHTTLSCSKRQGDSSSRKEEKSSGGDKKKKQRKAKKNASNDGKTKPSATNNEKSTETTYFVEDCEYALTSINSSSRRSEHDWIVDSGCTKHMTPYRRWFSTYSKLPTPIQVVTGSRNVILATGCGNVRVRTNTGETLTLQNVLHVPKLSTSLMSAAQVVKHGARLTSEGTILHIMNNDTHVLYADSNDGVFRTKLKPHRKQQTRDEAAFNMDSTTSTLNSKPKPKTPNALILDWHKKLGHMGHTSMIRLVRKRMAYGLPLTFVPKFTCDECALGKIIQTTYPLAQHLPVTEKLGLVHTDICGPVPVSKDGYRYFATLTDDATRYKWVFPLRTKNEVITKIKEWIPYAQRSAEKKLICIRSDHGAEFTSNALEFFLKEKGIEHQFSITYHPAQNGVA